MARDSRITFSCTNKERRAFEETSLRLGVSQSSLFRILTAKYLSVLEREYRELLQPGGER